jgi:ligand-binding sensor domain-containing protein/serine phosphatase RsbU (regulator of sigma subunit)
MKRIFYLIFIFIVHLELIASDKTFSTEVITVSQGLPNSQVTAIYQGSHGLLWIGTSNGLCIYDGYDFVVLQSVAFDSTTFADDNIISIEQDRLGNIWLLTQYGIELYNIYTSETKRIKYVSDKEIVVQMLASRNHNYIFFICENYIEKINIIDYSSEIVYRNSDKRILAAETCNNKIILSTSKGIMAVELLSGNTVNEYSTGHEVFNSDIFLSGANLIYYENKTIFHLDTVNFKPQEIYAAKQNIISLSGCQNNKLVYASQNSIFQLELKKDLTLRRKDELLKSNELTINKVFQDRDCLIWVASDQGLMKINPFSQLLRHNQLKSVNIFNQDIITETSKKGVLFTNDNGTTVFFNSVENKFYPLSVIDYTTACLTDNGTLFVGSKNGLYEVNLKDRLTKKIETFSEHTVYSVYCIDEKLWISTDKGIYNGMGGIYHLVCSHDIKKFLVSNEELFYTDTTGFGVLSTESCLHKSLLTDTNSDEFVQILDLLQSYDGKIWLATDDGLYRFNPNAVEQEKVFNLVYKGKVFSLIEAADLPEVWFSTDKGIGSINYQSERIMLLGYEDGVRNTSFLSSVVYIGQEGALNFLSGKEVLSFYPDSIFRKNIPPQVYISKVNYIKNKESYTKLFIESDTIIIQPDVKFFELSFSTLDYYAPLNTKFEYSLDFLSKPEEWRGLPTNKLSLGGLAPGTYKLEVRATNSHGYSSTTSKQFIIVIKAPVFQSKYAFLIYIILLILVILLLIRIRTRNLMRINREYKEKERIARKIELQKEELSIKNKNITDSINYARRIQLAMMPSAKNFKALFPDSFILHMPKDIVSGDFYWVNKVTDKIFFSAVDCTGHGVPGAFMSIIGVELFRRITEIEKIYTPAEVLNSLSKHFDRVFGDVDEMKLRDGMDLAFCSLNDDQTLLEYAGAFNPLYIIRDNSIIEIKGDRNSVGVYQEEEETRVFNNHVLPIQDQDLIYIFTDGFADQFGGPEEKKYKYRRFRHLLLALHQLPMNKQEELLKKSILEWKGNLDQVDDILVMGIRIHHNY